MNARTKSELLRRCSWIKSNQGPCCPKVALTPAIIVALLMALAAWGYVEVSGGIAEAGLSAQISTRSSASSSLSAKLANDPANDVTETRSVAPSSNNRLLKLSCKPLATSLHDRPLR